MVGEIAVALPLILWIGFRVLLPPGPYEFDFDPQVRGTFISILPFYQRLFWVIALIGVAGAVTDYVEGFGWAALLLLLAAIYAFLFNGVMVYFYEVYLHSRYPRDGSQPRSNYTLGRYSLILSLGFSAVVLLLAGVIYTAWLAA